ncbi:Fucose permease [Micromonospora nigra]|uniref:Fucose permease n=2 Tax=Micromonospora nigra TaxID=145857 RepID=A0A1C6R9U7_9ACTN|nr:Fucose permease [Micromonospora nigra]
MPTAGLRHNHDFLLLAVVRTVSKLGTQVTAVAMPLLVLAMTGSATDAGLVAFAEGVALVLVLLPAGLLADRRDRRIIILVCDAGALLAAVAVAALALTGDAPVLVIAILAAASAALGAALQPAAAAATRAVVAPRDLRAATVFNETRNGMVYLAGPPLGGLLFGLNPALPFLVDAASYAVALVGVVLLRGPLGRGRAETGDSLPRQAVAGVRFLWRQPPLRYTLVGGAVMNFAFAGVLLAILVVPVRNGASGLSAGSIVACVGLGAVIGSLVASWLTARIPTRWLILAVIWSCALLVAAMAGTDDGYVLGALAGTCALLVPAANVSMLTLQALLTPDHLQGRANAATSFLALVVSPFGPALAGLLLDHTPTRAVFLVFAAILLVLAVASTAGRAVRAVPDLRHVGEPEPAVPDPQPV